MLYTYRYIDHPINQLHENLCYFFERLFELEPNPYDQEQLLRDEFVALVKSSGKFIGYFREIAEKFTVLEAVDKANIKTAYYNHLNIEQICEDITVNVFKYETITNIEFRRILKEFLTWLWEDYSDLPKALRTMYGDLQSHFNAFKQVQVGKVCPFCGIHTLKPKTDRRKRNAYDHYIPKGKYPFVSVNFKNLFPACHECNSDEKADFDTPYEDGIRKKVLYPFNEHYIGNFLTIKIEPKEFFSTVSLKTLLNDINWDIQFTDDGNSEYYEAWDNIFKIKTRYKEYINEFEDTWFENFVLGKFKKEVIDKGTSFEDYKTELINDDKDLIFDSPLSIIRYIYFTFIFSIPEIEDRLYETVQEPRLA
jgi:hypothetical protein